MKNIFWIGFAAITLVLRSIFTAYPEWTETYYSNGIFVGVRWVLDHILGWTPFPLTYVLIGLLLVILVSGTYRLVNDKSKSIQQRLLWAAGRMIAFICGIVGLFYWLWGFNYSRISFEKRFDLPKIAITSAMIRAELDSQTHVVLGLRHLLQSDTSLAITVPDLEPTNLEHTVRSAMEQGMELLYHKNMGTPRGRQPFWDGFLIRFGALGIYNPFSGECNMDKGLPVLSKPYTLAHEFCHGYGIADEGTCNFLAYYTLKNSDNALLRYSAELGYWRELAAAYSRQVPAAYKLIWRSMPTGFQNDIIHIRATIDQYPEFFEAFRVKVYDNYLKAQGIPEGMKNYGKVVEFGIKWKVKHTNMGIIQENQ
ncbi:MAG: hypothetical protein RIR11_3969 [Bacteroidota bacterium]|jgi:hypothetical protein